MEEENKDQLAGDETKESQTIITKKCCFGTEVFSFYLRQK